MSQTQTFPIECLDGELPATPCGDLEFQCAKHVILYEVYRRAEIRYLEGLNSGNEPDIQFVNALYERYRRWFDSAQRLIQKIELSSFAITDHSKLSQYLQHASVRLTEFSLAVASQHAFQASIEQNQTHNEHS